MEQQTNLISSTLTIGLVALVVGLGIGYGVGLNRIGTPQMGTHMMSNGAMMKDNAMPGQRNMHDTMNSMMSGLEGKTGDAFDRAFLEEMIVHHEGAVEMAQALLKNTTRPELQKLGTDIITAQTGEIAMMRGWLRDWFEQN